MTMTTENIKDFIKTFNLDFEHYFCGKIDAKFQKVLGVYSLRNSSNFVIPLGGLNNKGSNDIYISLLIHYNNDYIDTESIAQDLFNKLSTVTSFSFNSFNINYINMLVNQPIDVGTDDNNIYERVIQIQVNYT